MQYDFETIIAIRHAESLRNSLKRGGVAPTKEQLALGAASVPDWQMPLSERGHTQAESLSKTLPKILERLCIKDMSDFTICTSGFVRCVQTADYVKSKLNNVIDDVTDIRLRERDAGYVYDMLKSEFDSEFSYLDRHHKLLGDFFYRPPGGESLADVVTRLSTFFSDLRTLRPDKKNLIIVSHGGTMRAMKALFNQLTPTECCETVNPNNCDLWIWKRNSAMLKISALDRHSVSDTEVSHERSDRF